MGVCKFCGQNAGLFASQHKTCAEEAEKNQTLGLKVVHAVVEVAAKNKEVAVQLTDQINKAASTYKLSPEAVARTIIAAVDHASREEPIEPSLAELLYQTCETILGDCQKLSPRSPYYLTYRPTMLNLNLSRNLWCLMNRQKYEALPTPCDIVLQKGEVRLAEFGTVVYSKTTMVSNHTGGYNGASIRIASGLYYRFGGYSGKTVSHPEVQNVDSGYLVLTNLGIVFAGQKKTFRVPYRSVIRFKAYPDALGFFRSTGSGYEEIFTVVDSVLTAPRFAFADAITLHVGWFLYNLTAFVTTSSQ